MRAFILAVTGLALVVAACSSYATSVVEVEKQKPQVASVLITLPSPSLVAGQTQRASVKLKDANGVSLTGRAVLWYTSAASVAAVTDSGVILGVSPGPATVSAVSEGVAGQAAMTVIPRPPTPVANVLIAINPAAVLVGQTAHATVALQDSIGNPLTDRLVTWQSGNPSVATVSTAGDISALAPGTAEITAASEGKTASASLTVSAPAPIPVATVSISPASSSLLVGATVQLSATTRDASGVLLTGRVVTWSSSNAGIASVNSNGLVQGVSTGPATITATSETKTGSASFTVTAQPPPPPPGSSNEPVGMTFINERNFDTQNDPAWYYTNGVSIVSDASAPKSPSNIGRLTYPAGLASGSSPGHTDFAFGNRPNMAYVSHWGRLSSNWYGDASGTNKICYFWANGSLVPFFISAEGSGNSALVPVVKTQALLVPAGNQNYSPNLVPSARIIRGQWFHLEIIARGNSSGQANGSIDWYLDGVHVGSINGLQFTSGATQWSEYRWYPVWGGNNGPSLPATQWQDADNIYISGKN